MTKIDEIVSLFGETLESIYHHHDCWGDETDSCNCASCQAKWILEKVGSGWRSKIAMDQLGMEEVEPISTDQRGAGAYPDRLSWHARERRLVGAFLGDTVRQYFSQIIGHDASLRDWRTAIGVVRWLGTNVGSCVLETAGWRYDRYKEDREEEPTTIRSTILERWTHGLGWLVSVTGTTIKDEELRQLAMEAQNAIQKVLDYLNKRMERSRSDEATNGD